jgi:hypothetical protein
MPTGAPNPTPIRIKTELRRKMGDDMRKAEHVGFEPLLEVARNVGDRPLRVTSTYSHRSRSDR